MKYWLAVDIGASSGRHILGWNKDGQIETQEVYRFANGMVSKDGHLVWDIEHLVQEVISGIRAAFQVQPEIVSLSIDTWAVDYVLLDERDRMISDCYAYRDSRTAEAVKHVHRLIPFETLYEHTGIQFQPFNTIYQMQDDLDTGRLQQARSLLMVPEYLMYRLCGVKAREYTNATTTGLVNARTRQYDSELLEKLRLPKHLFPSLVQPGTVLGTLKPEVAEAVHGNLKVLLGATHDTASAVEGIPMQENAPFISSGTWSLLGVKTKGPILTRKSMQDNFTNEGGVRYIRYLKNIMGLWMIQCLQKQMDLSFPQMVQLAEQSSFNELIDVNDSRFIAPADMRSEICSALGTSDLSDGDVINCVYRSLAKSYGTALQQLEHNTQQTYKSIYIAGGGAKNEYLNRLTRQYTNKKVIALPIEATAIGNLKLQMEAEEHDTL